MTKSDNSVAAIAEKCGVSKMTVSRALRNHPAIKAETRDKILEAAAQLGYNKRARLGRPRVAGAQERQAFELVIGGGDESVIFYGEIISQIEQKLTRYGLDCIMRTCSNDYAAFIALLENLRCSRSKGTILLGDFTPEQLGSIFEIIPDALLLDNPGSLEITVPYASFCFDNIEAARLGVRRLLSAGKKRILLLRGPLTHFFSREIEMGYRETLMTAGIAADENLIAETDYSIDGARQKITSLLDDGLKFDAVFTNDEMAIGVYKALHGKNLSIPEDVAVCGCDGIPMGAHLIPALTTVRLDYRRLAEMAVDHFLAAGHQGFVECRVRLTPKVENRESI